MNKIKRLTFVLIPFIIISCRYNSTYIGEYKNEFGNLINPSHCDNKLSSSIKYFKEGSYIFSYYRDFKKRATIDTNQYYNAYYGYDLSRGLKDMTTKYEIFGVLTFLDYKRVVFHSLYNRNVGPPSIDLFHGLDVNEKYNKKIDNDFKLIGYYEISKTNNEIKVILFRPFDRKQVSIFQFKIDKNNIVSQNISSFNYKNLKNKYQIDKRITDMGWLDLTFVSKQELNKSGWKFNYTFNNNPNQCRILSNFRINAIYNDTITTNTISQLRVVAGDCDNCNKCKRKSYNHKEINCMDCNYCSSCKFCLPKRENIIKNNFNLKTVFPSNWQ